MRSILGCVLLRGTVSARSGTPASRRPSRSATPNPAVLVLAWASAISAMPAGPGPERNAPLVMENADHFEGYRSRGEYVLSGKVRFRHGELTLETERAVWQKDRNIVFCESGMRVSRRGALLTAERGTYDKNLGQATAQGNVFMRDSAGEVAATGESIVYMRFRHLATLTGNPEVRRFYPRKDSSGRGPDTLSIRGDVLTYGDSSRVAVAEGNVRIDRDKMHITCKRAEYRDANDSLFLMGEPRVVVDDNRIMGEIMRLGMRGEEIKSLLVKGKAQAHSVEPATDSTAARQSEVKGDSLFLAFKEKAIDSVQVFRNADGAYFETDRPEFVNRMSGDYMVLRFAGKQVASANVLGGSRGGAKSTYYHFEKRELKGKNDAQGDTIDFAFKNGKIEEVTVKGAAKGIYYGEQASASAPADSAPGSPGVPSPAPPAGSGPAPVKAASEAGIPPAPDGSRKVE